MSRSLWKRKGRVLLINKLYYHCARSTSILLANSTIMAKTFEQKEDRIIYTDDNGNTQSLWPVYTHGVAGGHFYISDRYHHHINIDPATVTTYNTGELLSMFFGAANMEFTVGGGGAAGASASNQTLMISVLNQLLAEMKDDVDVEKMIAVDQNDQIFVIKTVTEQDTGVETTTFTDISDNVIVPALPPKSGVADGSPVTIDVQSPKATSQTHPIDTKDLYMAYGHADGDAYILVEDTSGIIAVARPAGGIWSMRFPEAYTANGDITVRTSADPESFVASTVQITSFANYK